MKNLAIFASGSGTNAQNIIEYFNFPCSEGTGHNRVAGKEEQIATVKRVICNRATAKVMERAANLNVPASLFTKEELTENCQVLLDTLERDGIDFIILAGYLLKIPQEVTTKYRGKIINIHPALLPAYGGKGMYGNNVHKAVIEAQEEFTGITIHLVDEKYDSGKILFQAQCPVMESDTPESLAQRVHSLEYAHFPRVIEEYIVNSEN